MDSETRAYRRLAVGVLLQAIEDARSVQPRVRQAAERFFEDPPAVGLWVRLAGLDPQAVQERLDRGGLACLLRRLGPLPRRRAIGGQR